MNCCAILPRDGFTDRPTLEKAAEQRAGHSRTRELRRIPNSEIIPVVDTMIVRAGPD